MGQEQGSEFYDKAFKAETWSDAPSEEHPWFASWKAIVERVLDLLPDLIVDIGCGPGQVASMLSGHEGIFNYLGYDFSEVAIKKAAKLVELDDRFGFINCDVLHPESTLAEGVFILSEFLEHVWEDFAVLRKIPVGSEVIIGLPTFDDPGHVRFFKNPEKALERYRPYLENAQLHVVDEHRFLITGKSREVEEPAVDCSLVMIVRDEEVGIARAIESVRDVVTDIVVFVDDRTKDNTARNAEAHGARVFPYEWKDDFAAARNLAAQQAYADWILVLDGHEYIENPEAFAEAIRTHQGASIINTTIRMEGGDAFVNHRVYRKSKGGYVGAAHNYLKVQGELARCAEVVVVHDRYGGQSMESRIQRSAQRDEHLLRVLWGNIQEDPKDTRSMFYLAQQHEDAQRWAAAFYWYERYNRTLDGNQWGEERLRAHIKAARAALALLDFDLAVEQASLAMEKNQDRGEAWAMMADALYRRGEHRAALACYERANSCELPTDATLMVDRRFYAGSAWLLDKISMCHWRLGQYEDGAKACEQLLEHEKLAEADRPRVLDNLSWHTRKVKESQCHQSP